MPAKPRYLTPGPGSYDVNAASQVRYFKPRMSSFGNSMCQYDREKTGPLAASTKNSTPSPDQYGMAAAGQALRVKIQPGNTKFGSEERKGPVQFLNKGPGPGQYNNADYNKVCATNRVRAAPKFSFGGMNVRNKSSMPSGSCPPGVGPNSYSLTGGMGKQTVSIRPTSPTWGLGSASRDQVNKVCSPGFMPTPADQTPGPGNYVLGSTTGRQVLSTAPSSPSFGQGTSGRPALNGKSTTPGPGLYRIPVSIKNQTESRRPTTPSWSFGTSQRPSLDEGLVG